jgi:Tol biopolymer transport system component
VLLYEMAAGRPAFEGKTRTSLIAAIVSSEPPPISGVQPASPVALDRVVRKCMAKDPEDRWQSAHDVADELRWLSGAGPDSAATAAPRAGRSGRSLGLPWVLAGVLAALSILLAGALLGRRDAAPALVRASLLPPPGAALLPFDTLGLELAPDGRRLAFAAVGADGVARIWVRDLAALTAEAIPETDGASYPFWSPDGTHLAFFAEGKLKKVDLRGGSPRVLADAPSGRGGDWGPQDVILFAPNIRSAIHSVPASGGAATAVTQFDPARETTHRWPSFLPDGKHFLYVSRAPVEGRSEAGRLTLAALDAPEPRVLVEDSTNAVFVEPGYLVHGREGDLLARAFDPGGLRLVGDPVPLAAEKLSFWEAKNFVPFTASDAGTIVYLPESSRPTKLVWYDRTGRPLETVEGAGHYGNARISPDGSRIAMIRGKSLKQEIWVRDLAQSQELRVTFESGRYAEVEWSADGERVAFLCQRKSVPDVCVRTVGKGGAPEVLWESPNWKNALSWLPDGSGLVVGEQHPETSMDLWLVRLAGSGEPEPLVQTPYAEHSPAVSPDGRWLAYVSDETGHGEVYLREIAENAQQWQVSRGGGENPRWRRDCRELFYAALDGTLTAVEIATRPEPRIGAPRPLFELPEKPDGMDPLLEDVASDGQRFLLKVPVEARTSLGFRAIFGWTAMLEE